MPRVEAGIRLHADVDAAVGRIEGIPKQSPGNELLDRLDQLTDPEPPRSIPVGSSNTDLPPR